METRVHCSPKGEAAAARRRGEKLPFHYQFVASCAIPEPYCVSASSSAISASRYTRNRSPKDPKAISFPASANDRHSVPIVAVDLELSIVDERLGLPPDRTRREDGVAFPKDLERRRGGGEGETLEIWKRIEFSFVGRARAGT